MIFNPQSGAPRPQPLDMFSTRLTLQAGMLCLMVLTLMAGCVSSGEYEAEKARALNYQRLLAQEEQRTGELDARLQEAQQEIASLGSQNRELAAERDSLREQVSRQPERVPPGDMSGASGDMDVSPEMSLPDSEFGLSDFSFDESDFKDLGMDKAGVADLNMDNTATGGMETPTYYTVVRGDTLYRISRTYGVTIEQLKQWNNLTDNIISIDQRLIVSQP
ncbi:MAG: LysM peptidoglycan-binding domain-containing protein [bacterium]|nr:LysM peptidoglycan-binding domain-containing protein [bacterium]